MGMDKKYFFAKGVEDAKAGKPLPVVEGRRNWQQHSYYVGHDSVTRAQAAEAKAKAAKPVANPVQLQSLPPYVARLMIELARLRDQHGYIVVVDGNTSKHRPPKNIKPHAAKQVAKLTKLLKMAGAA